MAGNWSSSCRQAVVAGDAAAACPGTAAVGPQTGQPRGGGVQTVVQDLACPLPSIYPPPPGVFYSHSLPASTQSPLPVAETGECRGVSCSLIPSHERRNTVSVWGEIQGPAWLQKPKSFTARKPNPCLSSSGILLFLVHNLKVCANSFKYVKVSAFQNSCPVPLHKDRSIIHLVDTFCMKFIFGIGIGNHLLVN